METETQVLEKALKSILTVPSPSGARKAQAITPKSGQKLPISFFRVEVGTDATGDRAAWVYVTLPDATFDSETRAAEKLRAAISSRVQALVAKKLGDGAYVYVRFRRQSDTAR